MLTVSQREHCSGGCCATEVSAFDIDSLEKEIKQNQGTDTVRWLKVLTIQFSATNISQFSSTDVRAASADSQFW